MEFKLTNQQALSSYRMILRWDERDTMTAWIPAGSETLI